MNQLIISYSLKNAQIDKELQKTKNELFDMNKELKDTKEELELYKSIFETHRNSAVFNLRIKTKNGIKLWVDKVRDRSYRDFILSLDQDDETREWLEHVRCER